MFHYVFTQTQKGAPTMTTPDQIKIEFLEEAKARLSADSFRRVRVNRDARILERADNELLEYMRKAVVTGENLPTNPDQTPVTFSSKKSMYTNAGGILLDDTDGIPVTVAAESCKASDVVIVRYNGNLCAMTVEEAFDRGLKEYAGAKLPTDTKRAVSHIVDNIGENAREALKGYEQQESLIPYDKLPGDVVDLKEVRVKLRWSQKRLADELGFTVRQISHIETGARPLKRQTALAVLAILMNENSH
jgi:DNA-binding XRE family transcriptional regulator